MTRKLTKKKIVFLIALFILIIQTFFTKKITDNGNKSIITPTVQISSTQPKQLVKVLYVIDGDTILIEGNKKVRYIGMDTPKIKDPKKPVQCFGQAASDENKKLVEGKTVILEKDVSETDKYGRLLRYVWLEDDKNASSPGTFVNEYLVKNGYAHVSTFPPDVKYADIFLTAEKYARDNNLGLWSSCPL